jgi:pilus assembly protein CpaB
MAKTRMLQIAVLSVALASGGGAFWMMNDFRQERPAPPPPAPPIATDQVLVATHDLHYGARLNDADTVWIEWPNASVPKGVVRKSETPNAKDEVKGWFLRVPIANGEPLRRERLIDALSTKLMSTILSPGHRAVAIDLSPQGANAAGGFILPNDHVDVIRTFRLHTRNDEGGAQAFGSETIVTNVRVLALGQTVEATKGESVVSGLTATLELDPHQTELIILAQRIGQLTLALRPMADWSPSDENLQVAPAPAGGPLARAFGILNGRLTIPRDAQNVSNRGADQKAIFLQRKTEIRRDVLNAN